MKITGKIGVLYKNINKHENSVQNYAPLYQTSKVVTIIWRCTITQYATEHYHEYHRTQVSYGPPLTPPGLLWAIWEIWPCFKIAALYLPLIASSHCHLGPEVRYFHRFTTWWRHQMETFSALLALSEGNSPVSGEFPAQRPVTRSFDIFFDLRLNKRLSKQSWGWWFKTP